MQVLPIIEAVKEFTQIENYQVEIWRRSYQRHMNLTVRHDGHVRVTCGKRMSIRQIVRFVGESQPFIKKRLAELATLRARFPVKTLLSGDELLFFGELWRLEVIWTWSPKVKVKLSENFLEMLSPTTATLAERQRALNRFFKKQAELHLRERAAHFGALMNLPPRKVLLRGQTSRWGSCSSDEVITLNWKLLAAPLEVIDYVVIHELAHIRHMNHSSEFWALVAEYQPQWKTSRRWLKEHEFAIATQFPP
jgi:predicted metal-dependent hydrolase